MSGEDQAEGRKVGRRAFVIMPFDSAFDVLHRRAIRPALEQFAFVAERYDDAPKVGSVLEEMSRSIDRADLVIAVVTGKNANVLFELGITIALGKPCVLLAGSASDVPDFLSHLPHVVYHGDPMVARNGLAANISTIRLAGTTS
jgi:nucleoside 2-deoxyribosyltransferase